MKTIMSFFMVMILALSLVTVGKAVGFPNDSNTYSLVHWAAPAYTDFIDSCDIPYVAGQNDLRTPDVIGY